MFLSLISVITFIDLFSLKKKFIITNIFDHKIHLAIRYYLSDV